MRKTQAITIFTSYALFAAIMIFGGIYPNAMRTESIYLHLEIFCVASLIVSTFILILWKKPNKWILYLVMPYFLTVSIFPIAMLIFDEFKYVLKQPIKEQIVYFLFAPYIGTFVWVLSLFMLILDYLLTRIKHSLNSRNAPA